MENKAFLGYVPISELFSTGLLLVRGTLSDREVIRRDIASPSTRLYFVYDSVQSPKFFSLTPLIFLPSFRDTGRLEASRRKNKELDLLPRNQK